MATAQEVQGTIAQPTTRLTTCIGCGITIAISGLVIIGWCTGERFIVSILPDAPTMKLNTAISFFTCGLAMMMLRQKANTLHKIGYCLCAIPLFLGLASLVQYYTKTNLGIDSFLIVDRLSDTDYPGRMSPATALSFMLVTLGILGASSRRPYLVIASQHLAIMVLIIAATAIVAFLLQSPVEQKHYFLQTMALHTSVLFMLLAGSVLVWRPTVALAGILLGKGPGSRMLRNFLKLCITASLVIGALEVYGVQYGYFDFQFGISLGIIVFISITTIYVLIIADHNNRADAELELKQQELEDRNRELSQFVYIASHDLQEPMRTVYNYSSLIANERDTLSPEEFDHCIKGLKSAGQRMSTLLEGLMSYSRIGRQNQKETVDMRLLIDEIIQDLELLINETHARIYFADMPTVIGLRPELRILMQNLIANAIRYRKPDIYPEITIRAQKQEAAWLFTVQDNGLGISPQHHEKIFQLFQQLDAQRGKTGLGIGLAFCRKVVQLHNGKIWVDSSPGQGSTFYFTLKA